MRRWSRDEDVAAIQLATGSLRRSPAHGRAAAALCVEREQREHGDGHTREDGNDAGTCETEVRGRLSSNHQPMVARATKSLMGKVAVVAGATRGAGRGIARALGEAGATVYCTGRSVKGRPSPYQRRETIDETAAMINAAGGTAIAVRVDHTLESEVKALFGRIARTDKRVDILVNSIAGDDPLMGQWGHFWQANLKDAEAIFRQALISRIITAKHARQKSQDQRDHNHGGGVGREHR